jgi:hypothetical protein
MKVGSAKWFAAQTFDRKRVKSTVVESGKTKSNPVVVVTNKGTPESEPCALRGEPLPPQEATRLGLGTVRRYYPCAAGQTRNAANVAGVVCSCKGCGPACPEYRPKENGDEDEQ